MGTADDKAWAERVAEGIHQALRSIHLNAVTKARREVLETQSISRDWDPIRGQRRRRAVDADIALRATGQPCPQCGQTAWSAGGEGCTCPPAVNLAARCSRNADLVREAGA